MEQGEKPTKAEVGRQRRATTRARIIAAAFKHFGSEDGLDTRIEDIARSAGVTRMTFYNHFSGMGELREAVGFELTHEFLDDVAKAISTLEDPRERAAAAVRFYLGRVAHDPAWGRSMLTLGASGVMFGAGSITATASLRHSAVVDSRVIVVWVRTRSSMSVVSGLKRKLPAWVLRYA